MNIPLTEFKKLQAQLSTALSENERYRKALEGIIKYPTCGLRAVEEIHTIARQALKGSDNNSV